MQLDKGARRMIEILVSQHPVKLTEAQWATLAQFKRTGGSWRTYKSKLRVSGLVEFDAQGFVAPTEAALEQFAHALGTSLNQDEVVAMWRAKLDRGAAAMLDALIAVYPDGLSRAELAEQLGMAITGGSFRTYLSKLRVNGLAEVAGDQVRAGEALFLGK